MKEGKKVKTVVITVRTVATRAINTAQPKLTAIYCKHRRLWLVVGRVDENDLHF